MSEDHDPGRSRQIIAAIIVLVILVGGGLWLTRAIRSASQLQDCVSAGRTNCAPIAN